LLSPDDGGRLFDGVGEDHGVHGGRARPRRSRGRRFGQATGERAWIEGGAPALGRVDGAPCLPHPAYEPASAPEPPPGGHQIVFDGPMLDPGKEVEGCMWVRVPNTEDFAVGRWEYTMNPGTHHFALWEHERGADPELGVFRPGDLGCFQTGAPVDGRTISGAGEAPYFVDAYPPGVGRIIRGGQLIGLNAHYFNEFDVPIQLKVWINMYPVDGPFAHEVETLFSGFAPFGDDNAYNFKVPPFSTATHRLRMVNPAPATFGVTAQDEMCFLTGFYFTD
jgi:hypothetical protein